MRLPGSPKAFSPFLIKDHETTTPSQPPFFANFPRVHPLPEKTIKHPHPFQRFHPPGPLPKSPPFKNTTSRQPLKCQQNLDFKKDHEALRLLSSTFKFASKNRVEFKGIGGRPGDFRPLKSHFCAFSVEKTLQIPVSTSSRFGKRRSAPPRFWIRGCRTPDFLENASPEIRWGAFLLEIPGPAATLRTFGALFFILRSNKFQNRGISWRWRGLKHPTRTQKNARRAMTPPAGIKKPTPGRNRWSQQQEYRCCSTNGAAGRIYL